MHKITSTIEKFVDELILKTKNHKFQKDSAFNKSGLIKQFKFALQKGNEYFILFYVEKVNNSLHVKPLRVRFLSIL